MTRERKRKTDDVNLEREREKKIHTHIRKINKENETDFEHFIVN